MVRVSGVGVEGRFAEFRGAAGVQVLDRRGVAAGHRGPIGYLRMQSPTPPARPHLAPVPCRVAEPSLQIADTSTSPSLHAIKSPDASTWRRPLAAPAGPGSPFGPIGPAGPVSPRSPRTP